MLLSPLFMLLYSAALIIAVPSSLVSRGFEWRSLGGSTGLQFDLLAGSGSLTTYPTICGMCCTLFHSHSESLTRLRPWCGGACLAGRPPICASSAALSPHVQAVVHSGPLLTVIWWSHSPAL